MARPAFDPMSILANNPFYLGAPNTPVPKWTTDSLGRPVRTQAFTDPKTVTPEALTGKAYGFTPDSNLGAQEVLDMANANQGVGRPQSISDVWKQIEQRPELMRVYRDRYYQRHAPETLNDFVGRWSPDDRKRAWVENLIRQYDQSGTQLGQQSITMPDGTVAYPEVRKRVLIEDLIKQSNQPELARVLNAAQNFRPQPPSGQTGGQTNPLYEFVSNNQPVPSQPPPLPQFPPQNIPPYTGGPFNPSVGQSRKLPGGVVKWIGKGPGQGLPSKQPRAVPEGPGRPSTTGPKYIPPSTGGTVTKTNRGVIYRPTRPAGTPSGSNSIGAAFQKATIGR